MRITKGKMAAARAGCVLKQRKLTIYKMIGKKNNGTVPCYVCNRHVKLKNATLEHIRPLSKGGTHEIENLAISHYQCNQARGNDEDFSWENN